MRREKVLILFVVLWTACTPLALLWGFRIDWPDNYHIDYGLPVIWSTHILNSLVGPVDIWHVSIPALLTDLLLWHVILVAVVAIVMLRTE